MEIKKNKKIQFHRGKKEIGKIQIELFGDAEEYKPNRSAEYKWKQTKMWVCFSCVVRQRVRPEFRIPFDTQIAMANRGIGDFGSE